VPPTPGVGGYTNPGWDLVSNMVGSVLGGLVCWRRGGDSLSDNSDG